MGFSRQEYWSGLPFSSPRGLPNLGIESGSPALRADSLPSEPPGKPIIIESKLPWCSVHCEHLTAAAAFFFFFKYLFIYFAALGLSCGTQDLSLLCAGFSLVAARGLSCPAACGILVPQPGMEPTSPALEGGFLTTGPPEKSLLLNPNERVSGTWTLTHPKLKLVFKAAEGLAGLCGWGYSNEQVW